LRAQGLGRVNGIEGLGWTTVLQAMGGQQHRGLGVDGIEGLGWTTTMRGCQRGLDNGVGSCEVDDDANFR
jgi:hypothetical protein